jgi:hypothetical protein
MMLGLAAVIVAPARTAKLLAVPRSTSIAVALRCRKMAAATTTANLGWKEVFILR